jgi:hypothetical protein
MKYKMGGNKVKNNKEGRARVFSWVPESMHSTAKKQAIDEGITLEQLVEKALREYLDNRKLRIVK